jgi:hypothetical protein
MVSLHFSCKFGLAIILHRSISSMYAI